MAPSVNLSKELYEKAERAKGPAGFETVDQYVAFVLDQVLKPADAPSDQDEKVKKRLRSLGYMD